MKLKIVWFYAKNMNIYGDYGNILALQKQAELRGIEAEIVKYDVGDEFPADADIVIGGGGQDSGQGKIQDDLLKIAPILRDLAEKNVPMLMICGLYQLFGDYFETSTGEKIKGICLFEGVKTVAGETRMIGNIVENSRDFGEIIGYENHSGQTFISKKTASFADVSKGDGNNPDTPEEGARYKNVIGTYLHGAILPKNPRITEFFLREACQNRGEDLPEILPKFAEDFDKLSRIIDMAREIAKSRPR